MKKDAKRRRIGASAMAFAVAFATVVAGVPGLVSGTVTANAAETTVKEYAVTLTTNGQDVSVEDAVAALDAGKEVKFYGKSMAAVFGSFTARGKENFRIGNYIEKAGNNEKISLGSAVGADDTVTGQGTKASPYVVDEVSVNSTSKNLNAVLVEGNTKETDGDANGNLDSSKAVYVDVKNPTIINDGKSSGDNDASDFTGWGVAVSAYDNAVVTVENAKIETKGVARTAIEADDGADVLVKDSDIDVLGGTLYAGYQNTADQTVMVSPPWVLGIDAVDGNARATNLLGDYSTTTVVNSDVFAKKWGVLSTDACTNVVLTTVDSTIGMDLSGDDLTEDSGYGTYAIGSAREEFYGTTINVPTYATICANGDNHLIYGSSKGLIQPKKFVADAVSANGGQFVDNERIDAIQGKGQNTVVNSENFGVNAWGGATIDVLDGTEFNTGDAAFLIKTGDNADLDDVINIDNSKINAKNGVIVQVIDNEDSAADGNPMMDDNGNAYAHAPMFENMSYNEGAGWLGLENDTIVESTGATTDKETINITNATLEGNIYNGSGYKKAAVGVVVNLGEGADLTGAISATTIKHSTDNGVTQNTHIDMAHYYQLGHVVNKAWYNGSNNVTVNLEDGAKWTVDEDSILTKLTASDDSVITIKAGCSLTVGETTVSAEGEDKVVTAADFPAGDDTPGGDTPGGDTPGGDMPGGPGGDMPGGPGGDDQEAEDLTPVVVESLDIENGAVVKSITKDSDGNYVVEDEHGHKVIYTYTAIAVKDEEPDTPTPPITPELKDQTIKVTNTSKTYTVKKLQKKAQSFKLKVSVKDNAKVTVNVKKINKKSEKALTINNKGKITVAKNTKKGTYTAKVTVKAAKTTNYKAKTQNCKVTVNVK